MMISCTPFFPHCDSTSILEIKMTGQELRDLRLKAKAAIRARDAVPQIGGKEWLLKHAEARALALREARETEKLAKDPHTRYGDWRDYTDNLLMTLGYL